MKTPSRGGIFQLKQPVALRLALTLIVALQLVFSGSGAHALPSGANVTHGSASFQAGDNSLTVHQTTDKLITNWQSFSISQGNTVRFNQPSSASAALNRVLGGTRSMLDGTLEANGKIILINPAGITVGPTGVINVNSFTASTLDITDDEFLGNGDYLFKGDSTSSVENHGLIRAAGGDAFLIAREVVNNGTIEAANGTVGLAAGSEVLIKPAGEQRIYIKPSSKAGQVTQTKQGKIQAAAAEVVASGNPYATAINLDGLISVKGTAAKPKGSVKIDSGAGSTKISGTVKARRSNQSGGTITIGNKEADLEISGTLDAVGEVGDGGSIRLTGRNVNLKTGSLVNASGAAKGGSIRAEAAQVLRGEGTIQATGLRAAGGLIEVCGNTIELLSTFMANASAAQVGGGEVYIGGGYQGKDPDKPNADNVFIAKDAKLLANAGTIGDGGKVIVWGNKNTFFHGSIEAKGGSIMGNGGFAEVSSPVNLAYRGTVNLLATLGKNGQLLLDPTSIIIISQDTIAANNPDFAVYSNPGVTTGMDNSLPPVWSALPPGNVAFTSYLMTEDLMAALELADVIVQTSADNPGNNAEALPGLSQLTGNSNSGTIFVADHFGWGTSGIATSLTLSAHNDIVIAASIYNASGGGVNLVADSDNNGGGSVFVGVAGLVLDNGVNNISAQRGDISIEAYGTIHVTGNQVLVLGGHAKGGSNARIGAGTMVGSAGFPGLSAVGSAAAINVMATGGNWAGSKLANFGLQNGAVIVAGGVVGYAQIGHGGALNELKADGTGVTATNAHITVNAARGGVSVLGGLGGNQYAYAQIGHGGGGVGGAGEVTQISGTISGDIAINSGAASGGFLVVQGGVETGGNEGLGTYAQIGHGGAFSNWTRGASGNITVNLQNGRGDLVFVSGGSGLDAYAQIGHGGTGVNVGTLADPAQLWRGHISIVGATTAGATALGGGMFSLGSADPAVVGTNEGSYSQIGHGGKTFFANAVSEIGGDILVDLTGPTAGLAAGIYGSNTFSDAYAQIGHGGSSSSGQTLLAAEEVGGNITVDLKNATELRIGGAAAGTAGPSPGYSHSQIGHGGSGSEILANVLGIGGAARSNILVALAGSTSNPVADLILTGGVAFGNQAQIGHGGYRSSITTSRNSAPNDQADITVTATGAITLDEGHGDVGAAGTNSYALIGHGGGLDDVDAVARTNWRKVNGGNLEANISITSGGTLTVGFDSDLFNTKVGTGRWAAIGHQINWNDGSGTSEAVENLTAFIGVTSGGDLILARSNAATSALHQIGHSAIEIGGMADIDILAHVDGSLKISKSDAGFSISQIGHGGLGKNLIADSFESNIAIKLLAGIVGPKLHQILSSTLSGFAGIGNLALAHATGGGSFVSTNGMNAAISVSSDNLTNETFLIQNTGGASSFASIGHLAQVELVTGNAGSTSNLQIDGTDGNFDLILDGVSGLALIGHASLDTQIHGTVDMSIDWNPADLSVTAGLEGMAVIGNGPMTTLAVNPGADFTANVTVNSANHVVVGGFGGPAQIGNAWSNVTADGEVFRSATEVRAVGNVNVAGGTEAGAFARIGVGGSFMGAPLHWLLTGGAASVNNLDVAVVAGGNVILTSGAEEFTSAQIGHGFVRTSGAFDGFQFTNTDATLSANIVVEAGGAVTLSAPASASGATDSHVQIGHGGIDSAIISTGRLIGTIDVSAGEEVTLSNAADEVAYVQIGHGGLGAVFSLGGAANGNAADKAITVAANSGNISLLTSQTTEGYVQIGHLGEGSFLDKDATLAGNIYLDTRNGDIVIEAASSAKHSYAKVGHDGLSISATSGFIAGTIQLTSSRDILISALEGSNVQVGHHSQPSSVINFSEAIVGNSDITVLAARDLRVTAVGSTGGDTSRVYIGHYAELGLAEDPAATDNVTLGAGRDLITNAEEQGSILAMSLGSNAFFGAGRNVTMKLEDSKRDSTVFSAEKLLTIVVDSASGAVAGPGKFTIERGVMLGLDGLVPGVSSIDELRIYTSKRGNNSIEDGTEFWVNGDSYTFLAGPTTGVTNPNGEWTYRALGDSAEREQWSTVWDGTLNGGGIFTSPFTVFYKDTGSIIPPIQSGSDSVSNARVASRGFSGLGQRFNQEALAPEEYLNDREKYYTRKNFLFRVRAKAFAESLRPLGFTLGEEEILYSIRKSNRFAVERGSFLSEPHQSRSNYEFVVR